MQINKTKLISYLSWFLLGFFILSVFSYSLEERLITIYNSRSSSLIKDRNSNEIALKQNLNGYYSRYSDNVPENFKKLLIQKEDRYFYRHPGFNPISIAKAVWGRFGLGSRSASSTITQQLVKILLGQENERNYKNKIVEFFYTVGLEVFQSKEDILKMYANSVFFGNQTQGISEASRYYFNTSPELLSQGEIVQLIATIHSPTDNNPSRPSNEENSKIIAQNLGIDLNNISFIPYKSVKSNIADYSRLDSSFFELSDLLKDSPGSQVTIDKALTEKIRTLIDGSLIALESKNVKNAAAVVLKLPENELLTIVGSPDPTINQEGLKINMAVRPRAIGSTIKPFIYVKAFEKGLRPYTIVDDQEYKYLTANGFPLYPKNFDYKYRGEVTLHYALSNSLNVPSVKVLEYFGLEDFYSFIENDLEYKPVQDLSQYQLGIALGSLEMSLYDLCHYFTIFTNHGILKDIKLYTAKEQKKGKEIVSEQYVELINKILSDRKTGMEQFGMKSNLNLPQDNYALKTGTSRDFKDSWIIGYTPDYLVGVWVGNHDETPTDEISGQIGAGAIWSQIMSYLYNSSYDRKTKFNFDYIKEFQDVSDRSVTFGLENDNYDKIKNALLATERSLIINPHDGDNFLQTDDSQIILKAKEKVKWFVNGNLATEGDNTSFTPIKTGKLEIKALATDGYYEIVEIFVNK